MYKRKEGYIHGDNNVICDASGFKCKASDMRVQWNGMRVHKDFWEARNAQDKLRSFKDEQAAPNPRPDTPPVFINQP